MTRGEAKAEAAAAKARSKAMRPWFKKKRFIIPLAFVVLLVIIAATSGGADEENPRRSEASNAADGGTEDAANGGAEQASADADNTERQGLYPDRADIQDSDHEAELGQAVRLSGYTATLTKAEMFTPEFGDPEFLIHVTVENRDDAAQPYNMFDWRIQTEGGQVLDPTFTMRDDDLGSGDLVQGGTVSGTIAFDVAPGTYYVIYKPDPFDDPRGIWKVTA